MRVVNNLRPTIVGRMEYKNALKLVSIHARNGSFHANGLSEELLTQLTIRANLDDYSLFAKMYSIKRISGDLDRLYRMGFLKRKRTKRIIFVKNRPPITRGFCYLYSISAQGSKYLEFLSKPKTQPHLDQSEPLQAEIAHGMHQRLPESVADFLEPVLYESRSETRGSDNRFLGASRRELLEDLAACRRKLARKEKEIEALKKIKVRLLS